MLLSVSVLSFSLGRAGNPELCACFPHQSHNAPHSPGSGHGLLSKCLLLISAERAFGLAN